MSITQQYLLDSYRARRLGEPSPKLSAPLEQGGPPVPAPGANDWQVMRELCDHWRFRAVLAGRPARGRLRAFLSRRRSVRASKPL